MGGEELKWHQLAHNKLMSPQGLQTRLKKLMIMIIIIIMNLLQETMVFGGRQKFTSAMKLRPEK